MLKNVELHFKRTRLIGNPGLGQPARVYKFH